MGVRGYGAEPHPRPAFKSPPSGAMSSQFSFPPLLSYYTPATPRKIIHTVEMDDSTLPIYCLKAYTDFFQGRHKCEAEHSQFPCPGYCGDDTQDALTHAKIFNNGGDQAALFFQLQLRRDQRHVDNSRNTQRTPDEAYERLCQVLESFQSQVSRIREAVTPLRQKLGKALARPDVDVLTLNTTSLKILVDTFSDLIVTSGQPVLRGPNEETPLCLQEEGVLNSFWDDGFLDVVDYLQEASKEYRDDSIKSLLGYICAYSAVALGYAVASLTDQCSVKHDLVEFRAIIFSTL